MRSGVNHVRGSAFLCACAGAALALALANSARAQADALPLGYATNFTSVTYCKPPNDQQVEVRLSGSEAAPLPGTLFNLKRMTVEKFNTEGKLEAVAAAPECVYAPLDGIASSSGHLMLKSGDGKFRTEGDGFLWLQNEQSLSLSNHVHTVIETPAGQRGFFL